MVVSENMVFKMIADSNMNAEVSTPIALNPVISLGLPLSGYVILYFVSMLCLASASALAIRQFYHGNPDTGQFHTDNLLLIAVH